MINGKYHTRIAGTENKTGKPIIIDAANIWLNEFEIMVMYPGGEEVESKTVYSEAEAEMIYNRYVREYTTERRLTGRYAALKVAIEDALKAATNEARRDPNDDGTSCLDCPMVELPRYRKTLVMQAVKEAGTHGSFRDGILMFYVPLTCGQADRLTRSARAAAASMRAAGYEASVYYRID